MLFRIWVCLKSLQAVPDDAFNYLKQSNLSQQFHPDERVSRCASKGERGSVTMEAALVFPLFLFAVAALLHLFLVLKLETATGRALTEDARRLAQEVCAAETEEPELTLRSSHQIRIFPGLGWIPPITTAQKKTVRAWTGFESRERIWEGEADALVYMTTYGTVYHRRLDCSHLKLSIHQKNRNDLEGLRNTDGAKYYPCEYCGEKTSHLIYITEDGNRYHGTLNCQALVRGIRAIRISETGGAPACSVCGGG